MKKRDQIFALAVLVILIVAGLFIFGKLTSFTFVKGKDETKVELKAEVPQPAQPTPPASINFRDINNTQGDVHVGHNFGLDENAIRKMFKEQEKKFEKRLESGPKNKEENDLLKIQLAAVQDKLADVEKALADREIVLTETQEALESAELKNAVPEDQLANAQEKLKQGDSSEAEAILTQVLEDAETHVIAGAEAAYRLGELAYDRIDYRDARKYYYRAVQLTPNNLLYLNQAGFVANTLGEYDKAIEYFEKVLASNLKNFGPEHPKVAFIWNNLGEAWREKGQYDKAIAFYEKALVSNLKTLGPDHPNVAINWNSLGLAWDSKGDYDKAIEYFEKALASNLKSFGLEHHKVALRWNNLGTA